MSASSPVTAGPPAPNATPPVGPANPRAASRSAAPAFMERLAAALGRPSGAPQDTGIAVQAPAAATAAGQPTDGTAAGADAAAPSAVTDTLAGLPAAPATATGVAPASAAKPGASGPEPADPAIRARGQSATGAGRGARSADSGPNLGEDAAAAVPAAPAEPAPPTSAAPPPIATASFTPSAGPPGTPHPAHGAINEGTPSAAARRNEGAHPIDGRAAQSDPRTPETTAPTAEASRAALDAAPMQGSAGATIDAAKAAPGGAHDAPPGDAVIRAMAEAAPPASEPIGRSSLAGPATTEPARGEIPSAAQQIAAPLVALGAGPDQSRRITVRLDPEALGAVQVRIDRPKDGPARVEVTVERPETLALLLRDQPQLQRALDQAGVPPEGRSLVFQIATPDPQPRSDTAMLDHRQGGGDQPLAGDGGARNDGSGDGGSGSGRSRRDGADEDGPAFRFTPSAAQRRLRDGLDITA